MRRAKAKWRLKSNFELSPERLAGRQILPQEIRMISSPNPGPVGKVSSPFRTSGARFAAIPSM